MNLKDAVRKARVLLAKYQERDPVDPELDPVLEKVKANMLEAARDGRGRFCVVSLYDHDDEGRPIPGGVTERLMRRLEGQGLDVRVVVRERDDGRKVLDYLEVNFA